MFKDILLFIFTPPGLGIWPGVLALYFWKKKPKQAWGWLFIAVLFGWVFSTPAMGRVISTTIIANVKAPNNVAPENVDMIVVLTGGMHYVGHGGWLPSAQSYQRAMVAYDIQARVGSRVPIVISGGKTAGVQYPSEAKVVSDLLNRQRAQITPTILEENALNTYENAQEVARLVHDRGADTIFLVTSELHMLRALAAFRARGLDPMPIPVFSINRGKLAFSDFLPTMKGAEENYGALYELLGLARYLMAGYVRWADVFYTPAHSKAES